MSERDSSLSTTSYASVVICFPLDIHSEGRETESQNSLTLHSHRVYGYRTCKNVYWLFKFLLLRNVFSVHWPLLLSCRYFQLSLFFFFPPDSHCCVSWQRFSHVLWAGRSRSCAIQKLFNAMCPELLTWIIRKEKPQLRNYLDLIGLWACLRGLILIINWCRGAQPTWMAPPLGRWSQALYENQLSLNGWVSQQAVFLRDFCHEFLSDGLWPGVWTK